MEKILSKLKNKENLSFQESIDAFNIIMEGKANDQEMFEFLTFLSNKGEVASEVAGGVSVLRDKANKVTIDNCIDTCGTGGDGKDTLNISTASALLLASMGINVAKHGNNHGRDNAPPITFLRVHLHPLADQDFCINIHDYERLRQP